MGKRVQVKTGYSFIGPGMQAYPEGTIFEDISEEQIQDQMWKLEILPSKKASEKAGIDLTEDNAPKTDEESRKAAQEDFNKENGSGSEDEDEKVEPSDEKLPPIKSEEEIAEDEAADALEQDEEESAAEGDESPGDEDEPSEPAEDDKEAEHKHDCCDEEKEDEKEAPAETPKKRKKRG